MQPVIAMCNTQKITSRIQGTDTTWGRCRVDRTCTVLQHIPGNTHTHWKRNVVILTKFSSLAAPEVVMLTTSGAANDANFVKMLVFPFRCPSYICMLGCDRYQSILCKSGGDTNHAVEVILSTGPANERRRFIVTSSLVGWAHTQNDPWLCYYLYVDCRLRE